jgi:uncharacterized protein
MLNDVIKQRGHELMFRKELPEVRITQTAEIELKQPLVVVGFAGAGLVGGIAVSHIIDQLKMKEIAHLQSRYMPAAAVFFDGKLRNPFRIHSNREGDFCVVVCEVPLRSYGIYPIASALLDWAEEKNVRELVVLDGVAVRGIPKKHESFCVAEPEKLKDCEEKGVKSARAGIIQGIAGAILNECLTRKIIGVAFLVPAVAFMPDPEGAASLIETLNHVYDLNINTKVLFQKAEEIKQKLKKVAQRHQTIRKAEEKKGNSEETYIV